MLPNFADQVTAWLGLEEPPTLALNCQVVPRVTVAFPGLTDTAVTVGLTGVTGVTAGVDPPEEDPPPPPHPRRARARTGNAMRMGLTASRRNRMELPEE
jgi:hypothetical protein